MRRTKLVCTLGPASERVVPDLVRAGMDVARVNCSHGTHEDHDRLVAAVREAEADAARPIAVMADLSGPKVRLGALDDGEVRLDERSTFLLRTEDGAPGTADGAPVSHPGLASDLEEGDRILLADGAVELRVVATRAGEVVTEVVRGGLVRSRAGVNVPSERLGLPTMGAKDRADLDWALAAGVDLVAQSFVRSAEDVDEVRALCAARDVPVVAKVETSAAVRDAARIVRAADALMVARGDLGVETVLEEIPIVQKRLIASARAAGIPSIVATQMLESMVHAERPTRAEVSDVAGAVFDGADAVMLSAETAIGDHPVPAARTAATIAEVAETEGRSFLPQPIDVESYASDAHAVAEAAAEIARDGAAVAIACFTRTGTTARLLSAARPRVPILTLAPDERVLRRVVLYHGVVPRPSSTPADTDEMIELLDRGLRETAVAASGERVVLVASSPFGHAHTNLLKLHHCGS
ncbi:MAG TPA: pyruvate kinase [Actinomycetota bacterium]|nr:pyruvate kinase [Actinomycetota bacterium]